MANIKVELSHTIIDGQPVTFVAPCDCTAITGLKVYYPDGSKEFTFKDAHGNDLTGIGNLFAAGVYVKAILDVTNGYAYIQNADTNAYLEENAMFRGKPWILSNQQYGNTFPANPKEGQVFFVPDKTVNTVIGDWESGIWKVRNWSNGRVECWGKAYLAEVTADTEYPDAPYSAGIRVPLPQPIADGMLIATTDSMAWVTNCSIVDNGYAYFRLVSVNAPFETMTGVTVNIYVIKDNV